MSELIGLIIVVVGVLAALRPYDINRAIEHDKRHARRLARLIREQCGEERARTWCVQNGVKWETIDLER